MERILHITPTTGIDDLPEEALAYLLRCQEMMIATMEAHLVAARLGEGFAINWKIVPVPIFTNRIPIRDYPPIPIANPDLCFEYNVSLECIVVEQTLPITRVDFIITHDHRWFLNRNRFGLNCDGACEVLVECVTRGFSTDPMCGGKNYRCLKLPPIKRPGESIEPPKIYPEHRTLFSRLLSSREHPQFKLISWVLGLTGDTLCFELFGIKSAKMLEKEAERREKRRTTPLEEVDEEKDLHNDLPTPEELERASLRREPELVAA